VLHGGEVCSMNKLSRVQDDIDEATDMMRHNLEAVVGRGEHLELLVDKSDAFTSNARAFQQESVGLKRALWWKNMRMVGTLVSMLLAVVLVVLWARCGLSFCKSNH
jgi:vesicle-associated membrane protein 7